MRDEFQRKIEYMRISVTDRCNLRCQYCMPEDIEQISMEQILSYEEIISIVKAGVELGITHYRLTGGEPLVRRGCGELAEMIKAVPGVQSLSITTNGVLLEENIDALKRAGIDSINVSLDTLNREKFAKITGRDELERVLRGIKAAKRAGIPVKLNTVNRKGLDYREILEFGDKQKIPVRFIEMMPLGYGKDDTGVSNEKLFSQIEKDFGKAETFCQKQGNGPAVYYVFQGLSETVGFISAMNRRFCNRCNRVRLSSEGYLKLCLCYDEGVDLRALLRGGKDSKSIQEVMKRAILHKPMEHCFEKTEKITEERSMNRIGG